MKKLITAACVIAMAAVAQAGAAKWSATALDASPAGTYTASSTYIAYLFDADTTDLSINGSLQSLQKKKSTN